LFLPSVAARLTGGTASRTYEEYDEAVRDFAAVVGPDVPEPDLKPSHFLKHRLYLAGRFGLHRRKKFMIMIRTKFKWCYDNGHIAKPPRYGSEYKLPTKAEFRKAEGSRRREHGRLKYEPPELGALLANTDDAQVRAMIFLGLNCGFGQEDLSTLSARVVDRKGGVIDDCRKKTGVERKAFLWPESLAAVDAAIAARPVPNQSRADLDDRVFLTRFGNPWVEDVECDTKGGDVKTRHKDAIGMLFWKLNVKAETYRRGRNFYSLRRTFRTCADELGDQRAIALVMGHEVGDVADRYVEEISDARLRKVTDHVRRHVLLPALKAEAAIRRRKALEHKADGGPLAKAG
ncbi:MAG: Phage integrase family protein, partial [Phycisphaerales bacterium]|nr:Phage integrase family protein [Phycisphaerales bacterium]